MNERSKGLCQGASNYVLDLPLNSGVDFTNIFKRCFCTRRSQKWKKTDNMTVFLRFWAPRLQKLQVKQRWNWHQVSISSTFYAQLLSV